jgi:hypothetical protein
VNLASTNPVAPYSSWATAATNIQDAVDAAVSGDLVLVTNGVYTTGGRAASAPPDFSTTNRVLLRKSITLQSCNGPSVTSIQGFLNPTSGHHVRCVCCLTSNVLVAGFTLTNGGGSGIGNGGGVLGLHPATAPLGQVLSNNFVLSNCVISRNLDGGAVNCILNDCVIRDNTNAFGWGGGVQNCFLSNCTLTNNTAGNGAGGGADNSVLNNCLLSGNTESINSTSWGGGGASRSTLNNCILIGNFAASQGGGAYLDTLNNCLVLSNSAPFGGGAAYSTLNNCAVIGNLASTAGGGVGDSGAVKSVVNNSAVYYNTAPNNPNHYGYYQELSLHYCATVPLPTNGLGNITNEPGFLNLVAGDLHLQSNSPCINSGKNTYTTNVTDLDGNPRVAGGTVDIGPYEYQTPSSVLSYAYAQQYGLATDGSQDFLDTDGDGMNNWQEWIAGTHPTNSNSALRMLPLIPTNTPPGIIVSWQSVGGRTYILQRSTDINSPAGLSTTFSNIPGQPATTTFVDTNTPVLPSAFYRVGIQ